jgi:hypothetical protein
MKSCGGQSTPPMFQRCTRVKQPGHPPKEVGLDPTHPFQAEFTTEEAILGGEMTNGGSVSLVHDDRFIVKLSQDVAARLHRGSCSTAMTST